LDLVLDPRAPGELRISRLQLPTGQTWSKLQAVASYSNRNLILRDLRLSDLDQINLLNIDGSRVREKQLLINFEATVGGGSISETATLREITASLNTEIRLQVKNVSAEALNQYAPLREDYVGGQIEQLLIEARGAIDRPETWTGRVSWGISD